MSDTLDKLEQVARAATPGPWAVDAEDEHTLVDSEDGTVSTWFLMPQDATHAATFHPARVLALLAVVRAAKASLPRVDDLFGEQSALRAALAELEKTQ